MIKTLSVCLMVRNEAEVLERCLRSVKDFVGEVCITDTGSTDGTRDIARGFADRYQEREWPHHFGKARNWSLLPASLPYVMVLDADEYITDPGTMFPVLEGALKEQAGGWVCRVNNIVGSVEDRFWQPRVFRRRCVHYEGRVHHQPVVDQGWRLARVPDRFEITHTGYDNTEDENRQKYGPRLVMLALLVDEATTDREKAYATYQYGVGQYLAGYPTQSIKTLLRADERELSAGEEGAFNERLHRMSVMAKAYLTLSRDGKDFDERAAAICASRLSCFDTPDALVTAGQLAGALGQHKGMLTLFCQAYERSHTDTRSMDASHIAGIIASTVRAGGFDDMAEQIALKPHLVIPQLTQLL